MTENTGGEGRGCGAKRILHRGWGSHKLSLQLLLPTISWSCAKGEIALVLPESSSLPDAVLAGSRHLPSPGLAILWVNGSEVGNCPLANTPQWPREGLDPRLPGGWRMGPHTLGYLDNWVPAGVDTANMLRFPFAETQSGQTQEGWNKGPDSRDQPPK